eukprot:Em0001g1239a
MTSADWPASQGEVPDDVDSLKETIVSLTARLNEANEERAQAAEYGLVVLEEKQALQLQQEELNSLYESTKRELEASTLYMTQMQSDYEKRIHEVEAQRQQLLDEIEAREQELMNQVKKLDEECRQHKRKLKQATSDQEHSNKAYTTLASELDRYKKECNELKEENRRIRQDHTEASREKDRLRLEMEQVQKEMNNLSKYKKEYVTLLESNRSLEEEMGLLNDHYKSILEEKEGLEDQTRETIQALNEEREAKDLLERKLKDASLRPQSPSWEEETESRTEGGPLTNGRCSPTFQSTPSKPPVPSLLNDLHDSIMEQLDLEALKRKTKKAEELVGVLQKEKQSLEARLAEQEAEVGRLKEIAKATSSERDKELKALTEAAAIRDELLDQLKGKLSAVSTEKAKREIDLEELREELNRLRKYTSAEVEKTQSECTQEQNKNVELRARTTALEQQLGEAAGTAQKLEGALYATHSELAAMTEDMRSMQKAIVTLCSDSRLSGRSLTSRDMTPSSPEPGTAEEGEDPQRVGSGGSGVGGAPRFLPLELKQSKVTVQVHSESHTLMALVQLHDQLRSLRLPLEQFTRIMLERSLAHSAKHGTEVTQSVPVGGGGGGGGRSPAEVEAIIGKWKAKVAHKTEEVSNLRAIMKARQTTSDVALSTLKSKLEGQERTYQTELARLKFQIKSLKKERDEGSSLKAMYAQRCEDYIDEMGRLKKEIHGLQMENEELLVSLKKTIQKKLDLSTQLEEYQIERERALHIPKLLLASRV